MKKVIIAPDSFKGTVSALEICNIAEKEIRKVFPQCQVIKTPIADGGEGTVDALLAVNGGKKINEKVTGPLGIMTDSFFGMLPDGRTAVIEMAAAAGLPMVKGRENPLITTTYGVGQLIKKAVESGAVSVLAGLGGSCTNDGGCGAAAALGVRFFDKNGKSFVPAGGTLADIDKIDISEARRFLEGVSLRIMCDVSNPLYGKNGAAYIFGPQKGADQNMIEELDKGLEHLGGLLDEILPGISHKAGGGAAGGMGAGMSAMLGAEMVSGIDGVLDAVGFDRMLEGCDMVITGEGRIDAQSLGGKAVFGVCRRAKAKNVPVCAIVGDSMDEQIEEARERGLCAVFTTNRRAVPMAEAKKNVKRDMMYTAASIVSFAQAAENFRK